MFSIIQAAGWPIWPLIACSILALALVIERFLSLKTDKIAPPKLLDEAMSASRTAVPTPEVVEQLEKNSALGEVLASGSTPSELQTHLGGRLKELVKNPIVTVTVREITNSKVYIFGSGV